MDYNLWYNVNSQMLTRLRCQVIETFQCGLQPLAYTVQSETYRDKSL